MTHPETGALGAATPAAAREGLLDRLGMPSILKWGFLGVLLFMTGVGVESNFITPHLVAEFETTEAAVSTVISLYSLAVLVASYLSGVLSDLLGPRRVMLAGFLGWVVFEVLFLVSLDGPSLALAGVLYFIRGIAYPLFAFSFLVWVNIETPPHRNGAAVGWFYVMFTGGLPTLGTLWAIFAIPAGGGGHGGESVAMWSTLLLATAGFLLVWLGVPKAGGNVRLADPDTPVPRVLTSGLRLVFTNAKVMQGFLVRLINTAPQFGMFVILPWVITEHYGWGQEKWLTMTVCVYASNIVVNAVFGGVGDRVGWVRTVRYIGVMGCAIGLLAWWYVPSLVPAGTEWGFWVSTAAGMLFGVMLAGFVPMGAIMPALVENDKKGSAIAMYTTAAGGATFLGTAVVAIVLNIGTALGASQMASNTAVVWTFVGLYALAFVMAGNLRVDQTLNTGQSAAEVDDPLRQETEGARLS